MKAKMCELHAQWRCNSLVPMLRVLFPSFPQRSRTLHLECDNKLLYASDSSGHALRERSRLSRHSFRMIPQVRA
jgi:hypothetical protein